MEGKCLGREVSRLMRKMRQGSREAKAHEVISEGGGEQEEMIQGNYDRPPAAPYRE
jgi:hypothetical protein